MTNFERLVLTALIALLRSGARIGTPAESERVAGTLEEALKHKPVQW